MTARGPAANFTVSKFGKLQTAVACRGRMALLQKPSGVKHDMKALIAIVTIAALATFVSPTAKAQQPSSGATKSDVGTKQPKKASYGKGMRARTGAGCKMSGSC